MEKCWWVGTMRAFSTPSQQPLSAIEMGHRCLRPASLRDVSSSGPAKLIAMNIVRMRWGYDSCSYTVFPLSEPLGKVLSDLNTNNSCVSPAQRVLFVLWTVWNHSDYSFPRLPLAESLSQNHQLAFPLNTWGGWLQPFPSSADLFLSWFGGWGKGSPQLFIHLLAFYPRHFL